MSNSRNWTAQKDCPYAGGSVDVATGETPENPGDATFAQAFGAGPIDVYWSLEDSNDPPRSMAGVGSLSGGSVDVSSPSSTFDGTTYDNSPSGAITLTSPVTLRCTANARAFDDLITALSVTYETLDSNGDIGAVAGTLCAGNDSRLSDTRDPNAHTHPLSEVTDSGAMAAEADAPNDGQEYVRKSLGWTVATGGGGGDLTDATFPTYAVFDEEILVASVAPSITPIQFNTGNKQTITGTPQGIALQTPAGVGTFRLKIEDSSAVTSISSASGTVTWVGPVPGWAAKLTAIGCDWDGTNWTLCGSIEE